MPAKRSRELHSRAPGAEILHQRRCSTVKFGKQGETQMRCLFVDRDSPSDPWLNTQEGGNVVGQRLAFSLPQRFLPVSSLDAMTLIPFRGDRQDSLVSRRASDLHQTGPRAHNLSCMVSHSFFSFVASLFRQIPFSFAKRVGRCESLCDRFDAFSHALWYTCS